MRDELRALGRGLPPTAGQLLGQRGDLRGQQRDLREGGGEGSSRFTLPDQSSPAPDESQLLKNLFQTVSLSGCPWSPPGAHAARALAHVHSFEDEAQLGRRQFAPKGDAGTIRGDLEGPAIEPLVDLAEA